MKILLFALLLFCQMIYTEDLPKTAYNFNGTFWVIAIEDEAVRIEEYDSSGALMEEKSFYPEVGVQLRCANINVDNEGSALASWIECNDSFSRCVCSYYDGSYWQKKKTVSPKNLRVDPESYPAISLTSGHDATVAYSVRDEKNNCLILMNQFDEGEWSKPEKIYKSHCSLKHPHLTMDEFGTEMVSWIEEDTGVMRVFQKIGKNWKESISYPATPLHTISSFIGEEGLIFVWLTDEKVIQAAIFSEENWTFLPPIDLDFSLITVNAGYSPIFGYFIIWGYEGEEEGVGHLELATLNDESWEIISLTDVMDYD